MSRSDQSTSDSSSESEREEIVEEDKAETRIGEDKDEDEEVSETEEETEEESSNEDESTDTDSSSESSTSSSDSDSTTSSDSSDESILEKLQVISCPVPKPLVPPGQGSERTHTRNQRKLRVKKLKRLIARGTLQQGSTLADLVAYENQPCTSATPVKEEFPLKAEKQKSTTRIDVDTASRFIRAGLLGNESYDRAREEARMRAKAKFIAPTPDTVPTLVPRNIAKR